MIVYAVETMSADSESTLQSDFRFCESIIEDELYDRLGPSNGVERNKKLRDCIEKLQEVLKRIDEVSLFSSNEQIEELPTSSVAFLLVRVYLAYAIETLNVEMEKRLFYLQAAKLHFRQFLETLLTYNLVGFKLSWLDESGETTEKDGETCRNELAQMAIRRHEKVKRYQQQKELEECVEKLKIEQRRNNDESTERQILLALIRLWAIRSLVSLQTIDEEIKIVKHMEEMKKKCPGGVGANTSEESKRNTEPLKTFIITKTDAQKKVFGLGYPSIPTVTVDEWFDQMSKTKSFGQFSSPQTITGEEESGHDEDEGEDDETNREEKRHKEMERDEWRDMHRRGWGNTHNKG